MAITAIVSFTNLWKRDLVLTTSEDPGKECNTCVAGTDRTVWRDRVVSSTGAVSECCNMWIPWCDEAGGFPKHHITLMDGNKVFAEIWQARHADGVFVRYSLGGAGYESPGTLIPGDARAARDRECGLTVGWDGSLKLWERDRSAEIDGLPHHLHEDHMKWHDDDSITKHTGLQFLQFHRDFLVMFHDWYDNQPGADLDGVAAWPTLPPEFNQPEDSLAQRYFDEVHEIETNPGKWTDEETLGQTLAGALHGWVHHVPITTVYRDTLITNFATAPETKHFYQWHGLIDSWWQRWTDAHHQAAFISQTGVPASIRPGDHFTATVTMRNTGGFPWLAGGSIRLGSLAPADNTVWGMRRVLLAADVHPGADAIFTINATAPNDVGQHIFRWRMLEEAVTWFGESTPPEPVTVTPSPDHKIVPDVVDMFKAEAFDAIKNAGLVPVATGAGNFVMSQKPVGGSVVAAGSNVSCRLRGGKSPDQHPDEASPLQT